MSEHEPTKWADGVWIVRTEQYSHSKQHVAYLCDLPDYPYDFAAIMCSQDALCKFIAKRINELGGWSTSDLARDILLFLAGKVGQTKKTQKKRPLRRIDLEL